MREEIREHTSLELSKRLHEKGFRREHKRIWLQVGVFPDKFRLYKGNQLDYTDGDYPAYTFTELWGRVPDYIFQQYAMCQGHYDLRVSKTPEGLTRASYYDCGERMTLEPDDFEHESPAEALGLLVEWLIDNGHMEVEG
jgi:hypothetical protein